MSATTTQRAGTTVPVPANTDSVHFHLTKLRNRVTISPRVLVTEFHAVYDAPIRTSPLSMDEFLAWLRTDRARLRYDLIEEEWHELCEASDPVEVADALGDLIYVIYGMAIEMGINLDNVLEEIHRSNMSKLDEDGKPILREDGKILKGPNFTAPNLRKVLYGEG